MTLTKQEQELVAEDYGDAVCVAVGCKHYVQKHRTNCHMPQPGGGISARLSVSRYYWDLEPPVAVDFASELGRDPAGEVQAKKEYFAANNVLYVLVRDAFDGEGTEAALANLTQTERRAEHKHLLMAPRKETDHA